MACNHPRVGVGVLIRHNGKVLFGKRKGPHGNSTWCPPGGHLEIFESILDCGKRETKEEIGVEIKNSKIATYTQDFHASEGKHYITFTLVADLADGTPKLLEPDKFETWEWFEWDNLPEPLFLPIKNLVNDGFNPFDKNEHP